MGEEILTHFIFLISQTNAWPISSSSLGSLFYVERWWPQSVPRGKQYTESSNPGRVVLCLTAATFELLTENWNIQNCLTRYTLKCPMVRIREIVCKKKLEAINSRRRLREGGGRRRRRRRGKRGRRRRRRRRGISFRQVPPAQFP